MPRLNVDISDELDSKLDRFLPWGTRSEIVRILLAQLVFAAENQGFSVIEAIMHSRMSIIDTLEDRK